MDNQPIETKNYRKPKKNRNPMTMLVIGFIVGAALSTGSFWAGALYASGMGNQNTPEMVQTTATTATTTIYTTTTHSYDTPDTLKESVGLMYEVTSYTTCEITGLGTCADTKIVIPKYIDGHKVTNIRSSAFSGCFRLISIIVPDSITSIGHSAFAGCSGLTSITIPESVTSIDNSAFYYCFSLTNITIPNSVTSIGHAAFTGCSSLTNITIPNSVTSIGNYVFSECSNLTNITYNDTVYTWTTITKSSSWNYNAPDYTIYCTDGTIAKDGTVTYYN